MFRVTFKFMNTRAENPQRDSMAKVSRRDAIKTLGAAALTTGLPLAGVAAQEHATAPPARTPSAGSGAAPGAAAGSPPTTYLFFNSEEAAFIEAAVARLIPADEQWGGAIEAGVPNYIDKQLGGAWGAGERLYRSGPWQPGTPSQGYQLPLTPAELFRTAIAAINKELAAKGTPFAAMTPAHQDAYLKELETTDRDLGGVPAREFFAHLWEATVEGFFGDPIYGGNRDMIAWRMIGFPGAYASYYDVVDKHGIVIDRP